ncbi:MAG: emopamil-binding family protein [Polyangiales bacterium]
MTRPAATRALHWGPTALRQGSLCSLAHVWARSCIVGHAAPPPPVRPLSEPVVCVFAVTSLVYEQYIVFGVDLSSATDVFGRSWYWYAHSFDPIFLDTPLWLRIMCTIDAYVFGIFYLVLIYALVRERNWIRVPALLYGTAIVYSTVVYFGYEFLDPANRAQANLLMVFLVNIPYTLVPLLLMWRMRRPQPFTN